MDIGELTIKLNGDTAPLAASLEKTERSLVAMEGMARSSAERLSESFSSGFEQLVQQDLPVLQDGFEKVLGNIERDMALTLRQVLPGRTGGMPVFDGDGFLDRMLNRVVSTGANMLGASLGGAVVNSGTAQPSASVAAMGNGPVSVNMTVVTPDVSSFQASQGQLMADSARALNRAQRYV